MFYRHKLLLVFKCENKSMCIGVETAFCGSTLSNKRMEVK